MQLAGALYLGSGVGLALWRLTRRLRRNVPKVEPPLGPPDWPWLIGAILSGEAVAPVLLMVGLTTRNTNILIVTMNTINMSTCRPIHLENLTLIGTGTSRSNIVTLICRTFITATATGK
jgi:hypothetical protein